MWVFFSFLHTEFIAFIWACIETGRTMRLSILKFREHLSSGCFRSFVRPFVHFYDTTLKSQWPHYNASTVVLLPNFSLDARNFLVIRAIWFNKQGNTQHYKIDKTKAQYLWGWAAISQVFEFDTISKVLPTLLPMFVFFFNYYLNSVLFKHKEERKSFRWITINVFFPSDFVDYAVLDLLKEEKICCRVLFYFSHWTNPNDIRWRQPLKKKENETNQTLPPVVCVCEIVPFRIALFTLDQPLTELFSIWIPNEYDSITIRHTDKMRKKATGLMRSSWLRHRISRMDIK